MSDQELAATLRALIDERGLSRVVEILDMNRGVITAIVAGLPTRPGSRALARERLAARRTAGAPRAK